MKQPYFTQEVTWLIHTLCNCNFDKSVKKYRKLDSVLITQWKLCLIKSNSVSSKKYIRAPCHDDGKWDTFSPIVDLLGKCDKTWKTFQWTATDLKSKTYEVVECIAATLYYSLRKNELLTRMSSKVPTSFKVEYIKRKWIEHTKHKTFLIWHESQFSLLIKPYFNSSSFKHAYLLPWAQILITMMDGEMGERSCLLRKFIFK